MKKLLCLMAALLLAVCSAGASGYSSCQTYTYSSRDKSVLPSPDAYYISRVIRLSDYGLGSFSSPQDLVVDKDGNLYVADTNNNRIAVIPGEGESVRFIENVDSSGLNRPTGLFIDAEGRLYIADSGNFRVVRLNADFTLDKAFGKPTSPLLKNLDVFKPLKVSVSSLGEIYIICENVFEGIVEVNEAGEFIGYAGMNKVSPSLWDLMWRAVSTKTQKESMVSFLPISFLNMDMDEKDFIYATSYMESNPSANAVKRLNPGGKDVLVNNSGLPLIGDQITNENTAYSRFKDICYIQNGIFAAVDSTLGHIFVYSPDGYPMFIFGGIGSGTGQLTSPSAIDHNGLELYVLDGSKNQINVYAPTPYGEKLIKAVAAYDEGDYGGASASFSELIRLNSNCEVAYIGLGKSYLRSGRYEKAMQAFYIAGNKTYYSKALKEFRNQKLSGYFIWISAFAAALIIYFIVRKPVKKALGKRFAGKGMRDAKLPPGLTGYFDSLAFAGYMAFHPFKGFYEMKREKRGSMAAAFTIAAFYTVTMLIKKVATGFVFSTVEVTEVNVFLTLLEILAPFVLFCIANWCLTTLMDGEGNLRDIVMTVCYSLLPATLIQILVILASHILTLQEGAVLGVFEWLATAYTVFLIFTGTLTIHQYTLKRAVATSFFSIVGMAVILFIGFIFVNLGCEVFDYFRSIYREIIFR